jgi:hypothetical protein
MNFFTRFVKKQWFGSRNISTSSKPWSSIFTGPKIVIIPCTFIIAGIIFEIDYRRGISRDSDPSSFGINGQHVSITLLWISVSRLHQRHGIRSNRIWQGNQQE